MKQRLEIRHFELEWYVDMQLQNVFKNFDVEESLWIGTFLYWSSGW